MLEKKGQMEQLGQLKIWSLLSLQRFPAAQISPPQPLFLLYGSEPWLMDKLLSTLAGKKEFA